MSNQIEEKIKELEEERERRINKYIIPIEIELEKLREQLESQKHLNS